MKRCLLAAALFALFLSSCDFSFLDQSQTLPSGDALHCHVEDLPDGAGKRYIWHDSNETLVYFEDHYIQDGLTVQIQHFGADSSLRYVYAFSYDGRDRNILTAYYNSSSDLVWYQAFVWTDEDNLDTQIEYDASDAFQWARKYSYVAAVADGQVSMGGRFGPGPVLDAVTVNGYSDGRLIAETYYGEDAVCRSLRQSSRSVGIGSRSVGMESRSIGASYASRGATSRALLSLTLPTVPAAPALDLPADEGSITLSVSGRRFWIYDDAVETVPASSIAFDAEWYPTAFHRHDPARCPDIDVSLSYDARRRIIRKVTQYGTTTALDVSVAYDGTTLFPESVSTSGASLLLPLDYDISYDDDRRPTRISVSNDGNLLHYFTYAYDGPVIPASVPEARTLDPFRFMDDLMSADLVVSHFDGDDALVETFTPVAVSDGFEVDVRTPSGDLNGYYLLAKDVDGNIVSFSGHGANGSELWAYTYDYSTTIQELDGIAELAGQAGRLLEYLPQGPTQYANAFVYDLLM